MLSVQDVTVTYNNGTVALFDASFHLRGGVICALVGANGSGKSTLFKTIMGFLKPARGLVEIAGGSVHAARKNKTVAYVPQSEDVDWTFPVSVHDVVLMGRYGHMNFLRIPRENDKRLVEESLRRVEMWDYRGRQIGELSGGQKKRVFLARALAQQGRVILLDEPFTGVDVKTESAIIALLRGLRDAGNLILVSTHDLGAVPEFCDQAVIINRTVLASGDLADVFTEQNLTRAFGGVLRHFRFDESTVQKHDGRAVTVLSDDERPLVFGKGGHLEFSRREGREDILEKRAGEEPEDGTDA
ncbi:MAG: ATP-binding cassette domain-containing protein [Puniceicoccales bacterium]|jgi:manganese/iron transport system ATP-binding protein|nr:ATP-binding cassette domain-containing protein [Puniceicoccales bacterium]